MCDDCKKKIAPNRIRMNESLQRELSYRMDKIFIKTKGIKDNEYWRIVDLFQTYMNEIIHDNATNLSDHLYTLNDERSKLDLRLLQEKIESYRYDHREREIYNKKLEKASIRISNARQIKDIPSKESFSKGLLEVVSGIPEEILDIPIAFN